LSIHLSAGTELHTSKLLFALLKKSTSSHIIYYSHPYQFTNLLLEKDCTLLKPIFCWTETHICTSPSVSIDRSKSQALALALPVICTISAADASPPSPSWDDWVPQSRLRKLNDENRELASNLKREMYQLLNRGKVTTTSTKTKAASSDFSSNRGSEDRHLTPAATGRGQKRGRDTEIEKVRCLFLLYFPRNGSTTQSTANRHEYGVPSPREPGKATAQASQGP